MPFVLVVWEAVLVVWKAVLVVWEAAEKRRTEGEGQGEGKKRGEPHTER